MQLDKKVYYFLAKLLRMRYIIGAGNKTATQTKERIMTTVYADTINGNTLVGNSDIEYTKLDEKTFFESLRDMTEDDYYTSNLSDEMYAKVHEIYGIR
jgi:hypothetical protein